MPSRRLVGDFLAMYRSGYKSFEHFSRTLRRIFNLKLIFYLLSDKIFSYIFTGFNDSKLMELRNLLRRTAEIKFRKTFRNELATFFIETA